MATMEIYTYMVAMCWKYCQMLMFQHQHFRSFKYFDKYANILYHKCIIFR